MSRLAIADLRNFPSQRIYKPDLNVAAGAKTLNPAKRVPMFVRYGWPEVNYAIHEGFIMRRFQKLPKLLYFSGIVAEHPRSRCES